MIIDSETFAEIAHHVKGCSDAILESCTKLRGLADSGMAPESPCWEETFDAMIEANSELGMIRAMMMAVLDANKDESRSRRLEVSAASTHA